MSIQFQCTCGRNLTAKKKDAGRKTQCPSCMTFIDIPGGVPAPPGFDIQAELLLEANRTERKTDRFTPVWDPEGAEKQNQSRSLAEQKIQSIINSKTNWFYLLLPFLFLPLLWDLIDFQAHDRESQIRLAISKLPAKQRREAEKKIALGWQDRERMQEFFALLPDRKLGSAWLPYTTFSHYIIGGVLSVVLLLGLLALFPKSNLTLFPLLLGFLATALLAASLFLMLRFWPQPSVIKYLRFSQECLISTELNFSSILLGYSTGVGIIGELCQIIPLLYFFRTGFAKSWRDVVQFGMTCGVAFALVQAVFLSDSLLNGFENPASYAVRFISGAGLHAMLCGGFALVIYFSLYQPNRSVPFFPMLLVSFVLLALITSLAGLYETLLRTNNGEIAFFLGLGIFCLLTILIQKARTLEREANTPHRSGEFAKFRELPPIPDPMLV